MIWLGPYLAGCLLLVAAGIAKARRPADTARALGALLPALGGPGGARAVRAAASSEAALGLAALVLPVPLLAGAIAASYLAFAGFVAYAREKGGVLATCGCFGELDTPPTRLHVAVDLMFCAAAAGAAATAHAGTVTGILSHQPLDGVPMLLASAATAVLAFAALSGLARVQAARGLYRAGEAP